MHRRRTDVALLHQGRLAPSQRGRAGEPYLIARLGIVHADEPIPSDRDATGALLEQLRGVERQNPS